MRILYALILTFFLFSCKTKQKMEENDLKISHNLIIYYEKPYLDNLKKEIINYKAEIIYEYENFNSIAIKIPQNKSVDKAQSYFSKLKGILGVEKDKIMTLDEEKLIHQNIEN
ncbi:MAG: hypothetical protein Q3983_08350 [Capnocytophaga sp.]|nr:hypothetical protein [Capnocytophaga sp.]